MEGIISSSNSQRKRPFFEDDDDSNKPPQKKPGDEVVDADRAGADEVQSEMTDPGFAAKERAKRRRQFTAKLFSKESRGILNGISAAEVTYEDSENFIEDGIQIEPFNLKKEREEEDYFHAEGNLMEYVNENEIKDAWLDSVEVDPKLVKRASAVTNDENDVQDLSSKDIGKMKRRIADLLEPGETMDSQGDAYCTNLYKGSNRDGQFSMESSDQAGQNVNQPAISSQIPTHTKSTTKKIQRTHNFTVEEDNLLVSTWLNISVDVVQVDEQNRGTYWERITKYYHKYKNFTSNRTSSSLMNRWSTIQISVNKFCGYYAQIEAMNQSSVDDQDKIFQAMQMYLSIQKSTFQFLHCWNKLKYQPKWLEEGQKRKSRRVKNVSPNASSPSTPDSIILREDDVASDIFVNLERPLDRMDENELLKKRKNKECIHDNTSRSIAVILQDFKEEKKEIDRKKMELFERTFVLEQERLLLKQKKLRMEQLKEEERIILMDTTSMLPLQAEYYKRRQMEIMEKVLDRTFK